MGCGASRDSDKINVPKQHGKVNKQKIQVENNQEEEEGKEFNASEKTENRSKTSQDFVKNEDEFQQQKQLEAEEEKFNGFYTDKELKKTDEIEIDDTQIEEETETLRSFLENNKDLKGFNFTNKIGNFL
ncbi:hypothetical protein PPERSA_13115 [Pseudocohnilembus persalinus]|uniref:Uncharacterized protein n=1 Tax=Pseudocohnilembus persalinus TaxID=266149 RepID=A0A0V0QW97_PSEPJ|nr:hypothetical protein PPERSA_13115 [Pseudocohnilembus persalinus]|eukprot:KRX06636.1 hypothetical protein PPERSA_13115 [Pseudocohnilembus persalinus]